MRMLTALPVLLPVLAGGGMLLRRSVPFTRKSRGWVLGLTLATALLALFAVAVTLRRGAEATACTLVRFESGMTLSFRVDGMGMLFAVLVSVLWPLTTVYAFSYMKHEGRERKFFAFFLMSFGVVLGIAFAEDFLTLYIFYELLTLATLPLVMHAMTPEARWAGRKYLIYSFSGAAAVFAVLVFLLQYGTTLNFTWGGVLEAAKYAGEETALRWVFLAGFFGYGVKTAVCPLHGWLPDASVAPTPVTALLHAVAVVKSGVFAMARLIYFGFGADFLRGSFAQTVCLLAAAGTILFGSVRALRTPHLKRRLAYSTVSNLSYIVLGLSVMSNAGLTAGLTHMVYHALLKIVLFFCAGAVLVCSGKEYTYELAGLGRVMPRTMAAFTTAALGLMGLPPLGGFAGKWLIATACVENGSAAALFGAFALMASAVLTTLYLLPVCIRAFFPGNGVQLPAAHETDAQMGVPVAVLTLLGVALALGSAWLSGLLAQIGGAA